MNMPEKWNPELKATHKISVPELDLKKAFAYLHSFTDAFNEDPQLMVFVAGLMAAYAKQIAPVALDTRKPS